MIAIVLIALFAMCNGYPYFGITAYNHDIAEQKASYIESRLQFLEDMKRQLLNSLDAAYEDMFNSGCASSQGELKKVITALRKRIYPHRNYLKKVLAPVNPRDRNSIIRNLKIERRFIGPML
ncbi:Uncharacterized protein QTN25_003972 [Entamoeba marina]